MTTQKNTSQNANSPIQSLLKQLSGKWKMEIFRLAVDDTIRFSSLLSQIPQSNKQSLSVALKELVEDGLLTRSVISEKPLHIEYQLSEKGKTLVPLLKQLEN